MPVRHCYRCNATNWAFRAGGKTICKECGALYRTVDDIARKKLRDMIGKIAEHQTARNRALGVKRARVWFSGTKPKGKKQPRRVNVRRKSADPQP